MSCDVVRGAQAFPFVKLGPEVFVLGFYVYADLMSPEEQVGFALILDYKSYDLGIKNSYDRT